MYNNKQSVIITGGTSFIGVHLIKEYLNNNWNVIAVVRPNSDNLGRLPNNERLEIIEADIKDLKKGLYTLKEREIYVFCHLAWEGARVPYRDDEKIQYQNYLGAINAINIAKEMKCKVFIGTGSQAEYGKCIGNIDEEYPTNPITEYGKYKLKAYQDLKKLAKQLQIKFIWTRIFSVYGIYDYSGTLVMSALEKMSKNEDIPLTECIQEWDYLYVEDAARAICLLGETNCSEGVYNIASGEARILRDFVLDMKRITNSKSDLKFGEVPYNLEGIISFRPIINKLGNSIDWSCQVEFEEGIRRIFQYLLRERKLNEDSKYINTNL